MEITVVVVLFDENAKLGNVGELDGVVGDVADLARLANLGLDAQAVVRVGHLGVGKGDRVDDVVAAAADRADGETVAARAVTVGEGDVLVTG